MHSPSTMHPGRPKWGEFLARLEAVPRCTKTLDNAQAILATMEGVVVDRSLRALRELGGYCDCAILYNIEPRTRQAAS